MKKVILYAASLMWLAMLIAFIFSDYKPSAVMTGFALFNSVIYFFFTGLEAK